MMQRSGGATQHAKHTASSPNAIRSIKVYLYRVVYCCNWNACLPQSRYIFTETYTAVIGTPVFPLLDLRCPEDIMKSKVNHITPNGNLVLVVYKYYCCRLDLLGCVPWCAFVETLKMQIVCSLLSFSVAKNAPPEKNTTTKKTWEHHESTL